MRFLVIAAVAALSGCAIKAPVTGQLSDGTEQFKGEAIGHPDGSGTLTIRSNLGRTCSGTFVYVTDREGSGTFNCSDGNSGPFNFVSTGMHGTGTGTLGGKPFTFSFG